MTAPGPARSTAPRSAALSLGQGILGLEALAAVFSATYLAGLARSGGLEYSEGTMWGVGLGLAACLIVAAGTLARPWGRTLGWALQVPMLSAAALSVPVAALGFTFVVLWIAALRLGDRIDRERAEFNRKEEAA